jgi:lipid II:glycine glycyltransferase (peptidoglycan interpeptide bridge formation enzyme)
MIELIFTKEQTWLDKWDAFLMTSKKGNHLILSDWLQSYISYGFDFEIGLVIESGKIVGGFGVVIPKFLFFKFYIIPHGPVYTSGYETYFESHVASIKQRAIKMSCCYLQLSVPISSNQNIKKYTYQSKQVSFLKSILKQGKLFNYVYASYGLNWVAFNSFENCEDFLEDLTPKVRRNVRMPYNKKAEVIFVTDINDIEKGYEVISENARLANYSVRKFSEFKSTIQNLINKDMAFFVNCKVNNEVKAAGFYVKSGAYITNITGGVLRMKPDIKLGYMLQWEVIKKSFQLGYKGYNISMGGSKGVQEFKSRFAAETIHYDNPHYHLILKPKYFKLFKLFDIYLKPYKSKISRILTTLKS